MTRSSLLTRCSARWSKKRGLKSERKCTDHKVAKKHAAKSPAATAPTEVHSLSVSFAGDRPHLNYYTTYRRKHRPLTTCTPREVDLAIALAQHTRQRAANRCTAQCTTIQFNGPPLVSHRNPLDVSSTALPQPASARHDRAAW